MTHPSIPTSRFLSIASGLLIIAITQVAPIGASATPVTSAGNIPNSGISPGGVDMATGKLILVMRPDLAIDGPLPLVYRRYYASMLAREGLASGHLGPNWLGTYDWSLSLASPMVNIVTNRGQRIQFQQNELGAYVLVQPMDQKYRLAFVGGMWRLTDPSRRRVLSFDGTSHLLMQILDEHGNSLSLSYGVGGGPLSQVTDGLGRSLSFTYDGTGHVTMVSDGTRSVRYGYDPSGVPTSVTDAAGHVWAYGKDPGPLQGLLTGVTEPFGNIPVTETYDSLGRVATQMDAAGGMSLYAYDAPTGSVFTDPLGNAWTYVHDTQNRLTTLTNPATGVTSFTYDPPGRLATRTRPLGDMTSFAYDATSGYPSTLTRADGSAINWGYGSHPVGGATLFDLATAAYPDGTSESYGRDAVGNLTNFMDRGGFLWMGTYNARGQVLTATNPSGGVTTFTYDPQGRSATGMDNAGNTTAFTYDALSRLTQTTLPDASHRSYVYDDLDGVTSFTDERGKVWAYAYDANERMTTATDPLLEATGFVYDGLDRVTQVVDPLGHARVNAYDPAGRLMSTTDRSGRMMSYQHDALGRLTGVVDPSGGTALYFYDGDSRLISAQDPLGHSTSFTYDTRDRVTHVTDPVGTGFDYAYDSMGRLTSSSGPPIEAPESYGYDPRGLLALAHKSTVEIDFAHTPLGEVSALTDPNHNVWPRAYDPQGRPMSEADPLGRTTSYTYDSRSRITHADLPTGSVDLTYDAVSAVLTRHFTDGTTFTYSYDDAGRLVGANGASFAYDAAGRMTNSNGFIMTYDNEGRMLSETYAPGKVVTYAYDTRGLLSQVTDWLGGTTSFAYDAAGRLTTESRPPPTGIVTTYQYDAADRLIQSVEARPPPVGTPVSSITITRDALGRPTSIDRRQPLMPGATSPATASFTYDAASQIVGLSWDPLGRLVSDGSRTFQWDGASRLMHYAAGADSPRFSYDAFGQMLTRTQGNQAVSQGWNYGRGYPTNDDLQVILPPSRTSYNIHAPSGLLLYSIDGTTGARTFYHYDESGNTIFLTNTSSSVQTEYAYTPYGGVTALGQTADNSFTLGAAAGATELGSSGLFRTGPSIYDALTMRVISGNTTQSGPVGGDPNIWVELNPQPFPPAPGSWVQPGPVQSPADWVTKDPGPTQSPADPEFTSHRPLQLNVTLQFDTYEERISKSPRVTKNPGPMQSPADWVTKSPGPLQSPGDWVTANPGPINSPADWATKNPGPPSSPADWVTRNPGPIQSPADWVTKQPGPTQSPADWVTKQPGPISSPADWVTKDPGPQQSPADWVTKDPGPQQSPADWVVPYIADGAARLLINSYGLPSNAGVRQRAILNELLRHSRVFP